MELLNELADLDIAPAAMAKVQALFEQQQAKLAEKDFKITALTHELAYYKRVRFGKASEALAGEQRLLFEETVDMDLAAISEELEAQAPAKRQRKRAGRQPLPTYLEASSTAMSQRRANAVNAVPTWSRLARTAFSAPNWTPIPRQTGH